MPAPKVTEKLIRSYIEEGRGIGHGERYNAFIQLKRWNASPVSTQVCAKLYPFQRACHFLCHSEWLLALVFSWIGSLIREQFPMWPWPHPHPLVGIRGAASGRLPSSSGTIELCRRAGVKHGLFVGTSIPYIWTLDLVATHPWMPIDRKACSIVSVKPLKDECYTGDVDPIARGIEKLEVENYYAQELGAHYFVADRTVYPGPFLGQLEFFHSCAWPLGRRAELASEKLLQMREAELTSSSPLEWVAMLRADFSLDLRTANYVVNHLIWHQCVDVDLSKPFRPDRVPTPGGRPLIKAIRHSLVSGS